MCLNILSRILNIKIIFVLYYLVIIKDISSTCIFHYSFKGKSNVVVNCVDSIIKYNPDLHYRKWGNFKNELENKYPYEFLKNGSLLIRDLSERSSHFFCNVKSKKDDSLIYQCGIAVTIISPVILRNIPQNETVQNNTLYTIKCVAGGGDLSILKIMYFVNDKRMTNSDSFLINDDTKIECRAQSGEDIVSAVAFISIKRKGILTKEEIFLSTKCGYVTNDTCSSLKFSKSPILYNEHKKSYQMVEDLLKQLFYTLDSSITFEYYEEEECIDRLKRFLCSTFHPTCDNRNNYISPPRPICRESCKSIFYVACRKSMSSIIKKISTESKRFRNLQISSGQSVQIFEKKFIDNLVEKTLSILNCDGLPSYLEAELKNQCTLINLDLNEEIIAKEKAETKCFNNIGRNYFGKISNSEMHKSCINWDKVPQIYLSFYQQSLQNQSNFCRNPGGVFKLPMCIFTQNKSSSFLHVEDVILIPCLNIGNCKFILHQLQSPDSNNINIATGVGTAFVLLIIFAIVVSILRHKQILTSRKKRETTENIPLNNENINIYTNKVYKHTLNGAFNCPIYNAAHLEKVETLAHGEYGEIVLVQVVIDNITSNFNGKNKSGVGIFRSNGRRHRLQESFNEYDTTTEDDLILSVEKTFNEKKCWPFDTSSPSGCCAFAVIKYSANLENDPKEGRFNRETLTLAQLNHPNIIRFYGVCLQVSKRVRCRIVEYLPNGDIKSILTGRQFQPEKLSNHEKIKNGSINALKKNRVHKKEISKKKNKNVTKNQEIKQPQPAGFIDLNLKQLLQWGIEICDAVVYLHTKHLIHRDIASRNCLVGINLEAKLADFSFVQKFSYGYNLIGNPNEYIPIRWLPKETLEDIIFNTDTDVWMFGVYLWELMSLGKDPYYEYDLNEVYDAIISDVKLEKPEICTDEIYSEMKLCFNPPRQRPCLEIVKNNLKMIYDTL